MNHNLTRTHVAQLCTLVAVLITSLCVLLDRPAVANSEPENNMLEYLDKRTAAQEDLQDVRCWSSFQKLQSFLSGIVIEVEANFVRIEGQVELIESIWQELSATGNAQITEAAVSRVLSRRFPSTSHQHSVRFAITDGEPITVSSAASTDYSDTIEGWRLLQSWAVKYSDSNGEFTRRPVFSRAALDRLRDFLQIWDLALFQYAERLADKEHYPTVPEGLMHDAMALEEILIR